MDRILLRKVGDFRLRSLRDWRPAATATTATTACLGGGRVIIAVFGTHRLDVGVRTLLNIAFAGRERFIFLCRCRLRLNRRTALALLRRQIPVLRWARARVRALSLDWSRDLGRL